MIRSGKYNCTNSPLSSEFSYNVELRVAAILCLKLLLVMHLVIQSEQFEDMTLIRA